MKNYYVTTYYQQQHEKNTIYWILIIIFFQFLLSGWLQSYFIIHLDVAAEFSDAVRFYSGERYYYDIYPIQPPWGYLVDYPLVFFSQLFHFPVFPFISSYYNFIIAVSLIICTHLSCKIFQPEKRVELIVFISFMAAVFLLSFFPFYGTRQHKMIILCMPYFLLITLRIKETPVNTVLSIIVGVMAFSGFAISPFFLLPMIFVELYYMIYSRRLFSWVRMEIIIIFFLFLLYVLSIFLFYPQYVHLMAPIAAKFYYQGMYQPLLFRIEKPITYYAACALLFYLISYKFCDQKNLATILVIALIGSYVSYLLQFNAALYRMTPIYAFTIMLFSLLLCSFSLQRNRWNRLFILLFCVVLYLFNINASKDVYFFRLFINVFFAFFLIKFLLSYSIFNFFRSKKDITIIVLFGVLIFFYPLYSIVKFSLQNQNYFLTRIPLLSYLIKNTNGKSVYFFTTGNEYEYPLADYAGAKHVSHFNSLIWLWAYFKTMSGSDLKKKAEAEYVYNYFLKFLVWDLNNKKPEFVFNDVSRYKSNIGFLEGSYLFIFMRDHEFRAAWKAYQYVGTIEAQPYYKFDVYKRNSETKKGNLSEFPALRNT